MRKVGPKTIHLADLQRYVFSSEYVPQLGPGGEHELVFLKTEGMLCCVVSLESDLYCRSGENGGFIL